MGDDVELSVQLPGFGMPFCFLLGEVELIPVDHTEAALYTASNPTQQGDRVHLHPTFSAAQLEHGNGQPNYRVAALLTRDGLRLLPHGSFAPDFDSVWTALAELHADGSLTARQPLPGWLFVQ